MRVLIQSFRPQLSVSLDEAGKEPYKMRRFWIVTTDVHTVSDTSNTVSGSRAKQFYIEEHFVY